VNEGKKERGKGIHGFEELFFPWLLLYGCEDDADQKEEEK